jgi:hypothetical protein
MSSFFQGNIACDLKTVDRNTHCLFLSEHQKGVEKVELKTTNWKLFRNEQFNFQDKKDY